MVTTYDIAKAAGVSPATVSRVVNNSPVVSASTRQRVLSAIAALGYQIPVRSSAQKQVLVVTDVSNADTSNALYAALSELGYQMVIFYNYEQSAQGDLLNYLRQLPAGSISGLILHNFVRPVAPTLLEVLNSYPIVQYGSTHPFSCTVCLDLDRTQVSYDAAAALLQRGAKRLACFTGESGGPAQQQLNGFRSALLDAELLPEPQLLIESDYTVEGAYESIRSLLESGLFPDGIVCPVDTMALGCIRAPQDAGLSIPEDVQVISTMGMWCAPYTRPSISCLDYPVETMAQEAARQLDLLLNGQKGVGQRITLPYSFTFRESTRSL